MREILFRGKDRSGVLNHQWIYGALDNTDEKNPNIIYLDRFGNKCIVGVLPKTVGQYTGLTDKNGKIVFEGDIVAYKYGKNKVGYVKVEYDCVFGLFLPFGDSDSALETKEVEVVGNVFDNAELLEVK